MKNEKIDRINELAHLAKERPLTEDELKERDLLRQEYIQEWRNGTIQAISMFANNSKGGKGHGA